jgi:hypothetical protein
MPGTVDGQNHRGPLTGARAFWLLLGAALVASRLCHAGVLWTEEGLPLAAAREMLAGYALYLDIWFDKPPLVPGIYLLWGAQTGWLLRLAGAAYALAACALAWFFARDLWGRREAFWAAGLMGFALTFYMPSAVIPLAADSLMVAPHLAAVWLAWRGRAFWSGAAAGVAFLFNAKGLFVLAVCALWAWRALPRLALGFATVSAAAAAWLWSQGSLEPYWEQVWRWGRVYAGGTFIEDPLRAAALRTCAWLGFHAGLLAAALVFWLRAGQDRWRWAAWAALSMAAVVMGWRFFPRYFFQVLPVLVLMAARGLVLLGKRKWYALALLAIPLARFGPRYVQLAAGRSADWRDTAMDRDSRAASAIVRGMANPGDTLFVWGYRPEMYIYTGLPAATRFLDSQPLSGVPADRHLDYTRSATLAPKLAAAGRDELVRSRPTFLVDGLGGYNPFLAIGRYPDLLGWQAQYKQVARTPMTVIYRRTGK